MALTRWLIFNVCIALIPLAYSYMLLFGGQGSFADFLNVFSVEGELSVLSVALVGESIGDLFTTVKTQAFLRLTAGGVCTVSLILACFLSSNAIATEQDIKDNAASNTNSEISKVRESFMAETTKNLFITSVIASAACKSIIALEAKEHEE